MAMQAESKVWQGVHRTLLHVREDGLAQFLVENTPFPWVADTTTIHNLRDGPPPFYMPTYNELLNLT